MSKLTTLKIWYFHRVTKPILLAPVCVRDRRTGRRQTLRWDSPPKQDPQVTVPQIGNNQKVDRRKCCVTMFSQSALSLGHYNLVKTNHQCRQVLWTSRWQSGLIYWKSKGGTWGGRENRFFFLGHFYGTKLFPLWIVIFRRVGWISRLVTMAISTLIPVT